MTKDRVDFTGFLFILALTLLWGFNYYTIKVTNSGLSPVFTAFLRSVIASAFGIGYCLIARQPLFHRDVRLFHGLVVGLLFGCEFVCLYLGMLYTNAGRAAVLVYLAPFVVAIGAHFLLRERLNAVRLISLALAFLRRMPGVCRQTLHARQIDAPRRPARSRLPPSSGGSRRSISRSIWQKPCIPSIPSSTSFSSRSPLSSSRPVCSSPRGLSGASEAACSSR